MPEVLDRVHRRGLGAGVARRQRGARELVKQLLAGLQRRLNGVCAARNLGHLRMRRVGYNYGARGMDLKASK